MSWFSSTWKPRTHLQVGRIARVRKFQPEVLADIGPLGLGGIEQVDPQRVDSLEVLPAADRHLLHPVACEFKGIHLAARVAGLPAVREQVPKPVRDFPQDLVPARPVPPPRHLAICLNHA